MGSCSSPLFPILSGSILSDAELDLELQNWRKSEVDFETLAIIETMDPGTFSQTCFMPPIVTSCVFNTTIESRMTTPSTTKFAYARCSNPTRDHLESVLAKFDGAKYAVAFSSGQAALAAAILSTCSTGDHVIYVQSITGDTDWFMKHQLPNFGIGYSEVFSREPEQIVALINAQTKIILLECPSNPIQEVADIQTISTRAKQIKSDITIVVDNTILTPIFQRPLELGADVVVCSLTKYPAGHSDIMMGSVVCNSDELYSSYRNSQRFLGAIPSPLDCYLMIRSLKTFPLRMKQHFRSAMKIAHFLDNHTSVLKVFYSGLKSHPKRELILKQQTGVAGLISFFIKGYVPEAVKFIKELKYFRHGGSFASDVSMVSLPSLTSQNTMDPQDRLNLGIEENLIRISVGLECVESLIRDLDQALTKVVDGLEDRTTISLPVLPS